MQIFKTDVLSRIYTDYKILNYWVNNNSFVINMAEQNFREQKIAWNAQNSSV